MDILTIRTKSEMKHIVSMCVWESVCNTRASLSLMTSVSRAANTKQSWFQLNAMIYRIYTHCGCFCQYRVSYLQTTIGISECVPHKYTFTQLLWFMTIDMREEREKSVVNWMFVSLLFANLLAVSNHFIDDNRAHIHTNTPPHWNHWCTVFCWISLYFRLWYEYIPNWYWN